MSPELREWRRRFDADVEVSRQSRRDARAWWAWTLAGTVLACWFATAIGWHC